MVAQNGFRGILKDLGQRLSASLKAGTNEFALLRSRLVLMRARRTRAASCMETGSLAASDRLTFSDINCAELCGRGSSLLDEIKHDLAEQSSLKSHIRTLDAKAESAKIHEIRQNIARLSASLKTRRQTLTSLCRELGERIHTTGEFADRFKEQFNRRMTAEKHIEAANSAITNGEARRQQLNAVIGIGFPKLLGGGLAILLSIVWFLRPAGSHWRLSAARASTASVVTKALAPTPVAPAGLSREQLSLSSEFVQLHWVTWRPGTQGIFGWNATPDAEEWCTASAGVVAVGKTSLLLITNRHVLTLEGISATKTTDLAIKSYEMKVKFPSGQVRGVLRIALPGGAIDLALLEVDATGLSEGTDFLTLPMADKNVNVQVGDEVVAVGNPAANGMTFEGTQTFGHISAFQHGDPEERGTACDWIQTDTAINHGNSGGPLFVKKGDQYFWVGVNTLVMGRDQGVEGINLAVDVRQSADQRINWYDATKDGIAKALTEFYQFPTGVYTQ